MRHLLLVAALILLVTSTLPGSAEPSIKDLAARTEIRPFETMTLTDRQFLTGDKNGKAVMIAGELRIPQGASGRLPAVVLLHGSGGVGGGHELWAKHFNEIGIASFLIDRFSGRDIAQTASDQALLGRYNMILDAYRGADLLAAHPRIDPNRIAVIGFSRGGQSALYSSLKRFQSTWTPRVTFAAHIPLYASCNPMLVGDTDVSAVPIRLYHGTADDYVPVAPCRAYVERLRAAGRDAQLTEYPNAHHTYDSPLAPKTPTVAPAAQSVRACTLREEPLGTIVNASTGQPFTYGDPCIQTGPHLGYDESAANATRLAVKQLLRGVFRLD
jgi:dienelactone hydrolase